MPMTPTAYLNATMGMTSTGPTPYLGMPSFNPYATSMAAAYMTTRRTSFDQGQPQPPADTLHPSPTRTRTRRGSGRRPSSATGTGTGLPLGLSLEGLRKGEGKDYPSHEAPPIRRREGDGHGAGHHRGRAGRRRRSGKEDTLGWSAEVKTLRPGLREAKDAPAEGKGGEVLVSAASTRVRPCRHDMISSPQLSLSLSLSWSDRCEDLAS